MFFDFDKDFYRFTRNLKDMSPYEVINKDDRAIIVHNVVGLSKEDLKVYHDSKGRLNNYIVISGEKKNEITGKLYSVDSRFGIFVDEIDNVSWYVENGLLYIEVVFKKPETPTFNVSYKG